MRQNGTLSAITKGSVAALFVVSLSLAACGSTGPTAGGVIKIATELPVSGGDATEGLPTQYGADLAVSQNTKIGNYTLEIVHENDEGTSGADGTIGAGNIRTLLADPAVLAVVGPFNSGVAKVEMPVANNGGLTLISPSNTNPGLTLQQYAQANGIDFTQLHPAGKKDYYFRTPANDVAQGEEDAKIATGGVPGINVKATTTYVIDDSTTYGAGLANYFTTSFKADGGTVLGAKSITPAEVSSFNSLAATIVATNPGVVFYGGVTSQGGAALKKALYTAGYKGPLVGGDGIAYDQTWITTAGNAASQNTYGTVAAPDPSSLTSADQVKFKSDYNTYVKGKTDGVLSPYAAAAYADATIEIDAIKAIINSGTVPTRANVRDYIASHTFTTVIGDVKFDANGDNAGQKVFAIYGTSADGSQWTYVASDLLS